MNSNNKNKIKNNVISNPSINQENKTINNNPSSNSGENFNKKVYDNNSPHVSKTVSNPLSNKKKQNFSEDKFNNKPNSSKYKGKKALCSQVHPNQNNPYNLKSKFLIDHNSENFGLYYNTPHIERDSEILMNSEAMIHENHNDNIENKFSSKGIVGAGGIENNFHQEIIHSNNKNEFDKQISENYSSYQDRLIKASSANNELYDYGSNYKENNNNFNYYYDHYKNLGDRHYANYNLDSINNISNTNILMNNNFCENDNSIKINQKNIYPNLNINTSISSINPGKRHVELDNNNIQHNFPYTVKNSTKPLFSSFVPYDKNHVNNKNIINNYKQNKRNKYNNSYYDNYISARAFNKDKENLNRSNLNSPQSLKTSQNSKHNSLSKNNQAANKIRKESQNNSLNMCYSNKNTIDNAQQQINVNNRNSKFSTENFFPKEIIKQNNFKTKSGFSLNTINISSDPKQATSPAEKIVEIRRHLDDYYKGKEEQNKNKFFKDFMTTHDDNAIGNFYINNANNNYYQDRTNQYNNRDSSEALNYNNSNGIHYATINLEAYNNENHDSSGKFNYKDFKQKVLQDYERSKTKNINRPQILDNLQIANEASKNFNCISLADVYAKEAIQKNKTEPTINQDEISLAKASCGDYETDKIEERRFNLRKNLLFSPTFAEKNNIGVCSQGESIGIKDNDGNKNDNQISYNNYYTGVIANQRTDIEYISRMANTENNNSYNFPLVNNFDYFYRKNKTGNNENATNILINTTNILNNENNKSVPDTPNHNNSGIKYINNSYSNIYDSAYCNNNNSDNKLKNDKPAYDSRQPNRAELNIINTSNESIEHLNYLTKTPVTERKLENYKNSNGKDNQIDFRNANKILQEDNIPSNVNNSRENGLNAMINFMRNQKEHKTKSFRDFDLTKNNNVNEKSEEASTKDKITNNNFVYENEIINIRNNIEYINEKLKLNEINKNFIMTKIETKKF